MKLHFTPTLTKRIFIVVFLVNALVWGSEFLKEALFYQDVHVFESMPRYIERASVRLNQLATEQEAAAFGAAWQKITRDWLGLPLWAEVWTVDGRRIYIDNDFSGYSPLVGEHNKVSAILNKGEAVRQFRFDGERWSLRAAIRVFSPYEGVVYYGLSQGNGALPLPLGSLLILTLPLWWVVRRGLSPLRQLATRLTQRGTEDFSPFNFSGQYRELQPVLAVLESLLRQLKHKVQREHQFLQDAAHELRIPIAVISAQAHLLAKALTPNEQGEARRNVDNAMARAKHLLGQLDGLAQVSAASENEWEWFDVVQQANLALAQMRPLADMRNMAVVLDAPPTLPQYLQRDAFQLIVDNLLSNAIRYGADGGRVVVTLKQLGNSLLLSVADDGVGIPVEEREMVFERFYRVRGQEGMGSGLGLAIVRQAVVRLYATLDIATGLHDRGCCFSVWVPIPANQPEPEMKGLAR